MTDKTKPCPSCKDNYIHSGLNSALNSISRIDGKTQICSECGTKEAILGIQRPKTEQDKQRNIIIVSLNFKIYCEERNKKNCQTCFLKTENGKCEEEFYRIKFEKFHDQQRAQA